MFLLSYLSDFIIHTILVLGVIGTLGSFFVPTNPLTMQYGLITKIASIILLVVGVFFEGTIFKDKIWEARVAEAQTKILEAEKKAEAANGKIQYVYVTKIQKVVETKQVVHDKIKDESDKIDSFCMVVPEAVNILNISAKNDSEVKK